MEIQLNQNKREKLKSWNLRASVEMAKQAKRDEGFDEAKDRQRVEPATEAKPAPAANGARVRNAPMSTAGM